MPVEDFFGVVRPVFHGELVVGHQDVVECLETGRQIERLPPWSSTLVSTPRRMSRGSGRSASPSISSPVARMKSGSHSVSARTWSTRQRVRKPR